MARVISLSKGQILSLCSKPSDGFLPHPQEKPRSLPGMFQSQELYTYISLEGSPPGSGTVLSSLASSHQKHSLGPVYLSFEDLPRSSTSRHPASFFLKALITKILHIRLTASPSDCNVHCDYVTRTRLLSVLSNTVSSVSWTADGTQFIRCSTSVS